MNHFDDRVLLDIKRAIIRGDELLRLSNYTLGVLEEQGYLPCRDDFKKYQTKLISVFKEEIKSFIDDKFRIDSPDSWEFDPPKEQLKTLSTYLKTLSRDTGKNIIDFDSTLFPDSIHCLRSLLALEMKKLIRIFKLRSDSNHGLAMERPGHSKFYYITRIYAKLQMTEKFRDIKPFSTKANTKIPIGKHKLPLPDSSQDSPIYFKRSTGTLISNGKKSKFNETSNAFNVFDLLVDEQPRKVSKKELIGVLKNISKEMKPWAQARKLRQIISGINLKLEVRNIDLSIDKDDKNSTYWFSRKVTSRKELTSE